MLANKLARILILIAVLGATPLEAGFRSPESLVRNVYAYYGNGSADFSGGLPHDSATAQQFFDQALRDSWASAKPPYDFLVQSSSWKLGGISIAVTRRQYDKTYVAVAFSNKGRAVTLNYLVVNGPEGWLIIDVESPYDSLRSFLAQFKPRNSINWRRTGYRYRGRPDASRKPYSLAGNGLPDR
jgi:hypothetical protein